MRRRRTGPYGYREEDVKEMAHSGLHRARPQPQVDPTGVSPGSRYRGRESDSHEKPGEGLGEMLAVGRQQLGPGAAT